MSKPAGRYLPVSPFRRMVVDLMHFSAQVPSVAIDRRMNLSPLIEARRVSTPRPTWSGLFCKAFGMIGRDYPEMRRAYMSFPWPRLYEHPHSVATMNLERRTPEGENVVIYGLLRAPENRTIPEIDARIRHYKDAPLETLRTWQRSKKMSHLPGPLRRFVWWYSLNVQGKLRCHNYGTFGISSVAAQGAGILHLTPILTATLHYGLFDDAGNLDMRLSFDHRVLDGARAAQSLVDMESLLNHELVAELARTPLRAAA